MAENTGIKQRTSIQRKKRKKGIKVFAESKKMAKSIKDFDIHQWKALAYVLSTIRYSDNPFNETIGAVQEDTTENGVNKTIAYVDITVDKNELAIAMGLDPNAKRRGNTMTDYLQDFPKNSQVKYYDNYGRWKKSEMLCTKVETKNHNTVTFRFSGEALKSFFGLRTDFITMYLNDFISMTSVYSLKLYEYLRVYSDTRRVNNKVLDIRDLKILFNIPKDGKGSYMGKTGHFLRTQFEEYVLDKIVEDFEKCEMIKLYKYDDGKGNMKGYKKIKDGNKVSGYLFTWYFPYDIHPKAIRDDSYSRNELSSYNLIDAMFTEGVEISVLVLS